MEPSNKTFKVKRILGKKQKQNRPIPNWFRFKTDNTIRYNAKRRNWRRTKLKHKSVAVLILEECILKDLVKDFVRLPTLVQNFTFCCCSQPEDSYPAAKRFRSADSNFDDRPSIPANEIASAEEEDPGDALLRHQKIAIWGRMLEYKRGNQELEERLEALLQRQRGYESAIISLQEIPLPQSNGDVVEDVHRTCEQWSQSLQGSFQQVEKLVTSLLQKPINASSEELIKNVKEYEARVVNLLGDVSFADFAFFVTKVGELVPNLDPSFIIQFTKLKSENTSLHSQIEEVQTMMEEMKSAKESAERKLVKLKLTQSVDRGVAVTETKDVEMVDAAGMPVEQMNKEMELLKAEKIDLMNKLDELRIQLNTGMGEDRVKESPTYRNMEAEFNFHKSENAILKNRLDKLNHEYEELQSERRKFIEQLESDETARRKVLESELKKLETDLTRIRGNRDNLQHSLDLRVSKDELDIAQNIEIRTLANTRKDHIVCLEKQIHRLKRQMAEQAADKFFLDYFEENPDGNLISELRKEVRELKEKLEAAEADLEALQNLSSEERDKHGILVSEKKFKDQVAQLEQRLQKINENGNVEELAAKVKDLEQRLDYSQKTQSYLSSEVDQVTKAWTQLEDQSMEKVLNLTKLEDRILAITAERVKCEQKIAMISKHGQTMQNLMLALKRQSEKQLETIRKLEERERSLSQQLQSIEKDLSTKSITTDLFRRKVSELQLKTADQADKVEKLSLRAQESERLLKEKTRVLVEETDAKRKLTGELEALKRKVDNMGRNESAGDAALVKERDDYKKVGAPSANAAVRVGVVDIHYLEPGCKMSSEADGKKSEKLLKKAKPFFDEKQKAKNRLNALCVYLDASADADQARFFQDHDVPIYSVLKESFWYIVDKIKGDGKDKSDKSVQISGKEGLELCRICSVFRKPRQSTIKRKWEDNSSDFASPAITWQSSTSAEPAEGAFLFSVAIPLSLLDSFPLPTPLDLAKSDCGGDDGILGLPDVRVSVSVANPTAVREEGGEDMGTDGMLSVNPHLTKTVSSKSGIDTSPQFVQETAVIISPTAPPAPSDAVELFEEILDNLVTMTTLACCNPTVNIGTNSSNMSPPLSSSPSSDGVSNLQHFPGNNIESQSSLPMTYLDPEAVFGPNTSISELILNSTALNSALFSWSMFKRHYIKIIFPAVHEKFQGKTETTRAQPTFVTCPPQLLQSFTTFVIRNVLDPSISGVSPTPIEAVSVSVTLDLTCKRATVLQHILLHNVEDREIVHELLRQSLLTPFANADVARYSLFVLRTWIFCAPDDRPLFMRTTGAHAMKLAKQSSVASDVINSSGDGGNDAWVNIFARRYIRYMQLVFLDRKDYVENVNVQVLISAMKRVKCSESKIESLDEDDTVERSFSIVPIINT
ncbi:E3 ubiquitin-protein ligase bre1 [Blyttiomyces sp. JEL0837]|nr:E3 ubiquitin-protein ligase bre1 [Blyttiomyces sp. JEL0837]